MHVVNPTRNIYVTCGFGDDDGDAVDQGDGDGDGGDGQQLVGIQFVDRV